MACQSNEADAPELVTRGAQQIGQTSVVLEAQITEVGPVRPILFGLLWDTQPDLSMAVAANRNVLGSTSEPRLFSIKLENLTASTTYYYRGFTANGGYTKIYYGNSQTFTTLP